MKSKQRMMAWQERQKRKLEKRSFVPEQDPEPMVSEETIPQQEVSFEPKEKKLIFGALPEYAHGKNLRNVSQYQWQKVRRALLDERGVKCQTCGATPKEQTDERKFHAHEVWEYDLKNHIIILKDIEIICHLCHQTEHMGLWEVKLKQGRITQEQYEELFHHYARVNNCSYQEAKRDYFYSCVNFRTNQIHEDPSLYEVDWKYRLECDFPNKEKMTETLCKKGLLADTI